MIDENIVGCNKSADGDTELSMRSRIHFKGVVHGPLSSFFSQLCSFAYLRMLIRSPHPAPLRDTLTFGCPISGGTIDISAFRMYPNLALQTLIQRT